MRKKAKNRTTVHLLAVSMMALPAFGFLVWENIPIKGEPPTVEERVIVAPLPLKPPTIAFDAAGGLPKHLPITRRPAQAAEVKSGLPVRIRIASIAVDAAIERVGLTAAALMDVPKNPDDTGWYELGPRPGETGSAAIAGHVDWMNGATAVFADLYKVKVGDEVTVQDDKGEVTTFVVREIRRYKPTVEATEVFVSNDGKAHLNLITCDGVWNKNSQQYSQRLVVFTDRVDN